MDNIENKGKETSSISKEQIISRAFQYHSQGNFLEAEKYYKYFLDQGFTDPRVFSNYGVISQQLGEIDKAIKLFRKSIYLFL